METLETIKRRRSIRNFKDQPVEKELIEKLIHAASHAPSACNVQGWKFIIVDNLDIKNKMVDHGGSIIIKNAPAGILALYDNRSKDIQYHDYIQSASAAIQNINLTATDLGLGTCWVCHLPTPKTLRKIFNIPSSFSPIAYILIGHPKNQPGNMPRKYDLPEIINYNTFAKNWPITKINPLVLLFKKILVKIYYLSPTFIKKGLLNKFLDKNFVKKFKN